MSITRKSDIPLRLYDVVPGPHPLERAVGDLAHQSGINSEPHNFPRS